MSCPFMTLAIMADHNFLFFVFLNKVYIFVIFPNLCPRKFFRKPVKYAILCFPLKLLPSTCSLRFKCPKGFFLIICRIKFTSISDSKFLFASLYFA